MTSAIDTCATYSYDESKKELVLNILKLICTETDKIQTKQSVSGTDIIILIVIEPSKEISESYTCLPLESPHDFRFKLSGAKKQDYQLHYKYQNKYLKISKRNDTHFDLNENPEGVIPVIMNQE